MISALKVDIENELGELRQEATLLAGSLAAEAEGGELRPSLVWLHTAGLAAAVEKIYTGCERVLTLLVKRIDGAAIDKDEGWHGALLRRVASPFPDVRAAIITSECFDQLNLLRAFRHRVRNSYGIALDPEIVRERAAGVSQTLEVLARDVGAFLNKQEDSQT